MEIHVKVKAVREGAGLPKKATAGSAICLAGIYYLGCEPREVRPEGDDANLAGKFVLSVLVVWILNFLLSAFV